MSDFFHYLLMGLLAIVLFAIGVAVSILIAYLIVHSDLPDWLKWFLLN